MKPICVNGRFLAHKNTTGMQRYSKELTSRLSDIVEIISPGNRRGLAGHLWEQSNLAFQARSSVLWSPSTSGPILHRHHVVTIHDIFPIENPEWYSPSFAAWYGFLMRRFAARASKLIAVSYFTRDRMAKVLKLNHDEIEVIPNGVGERFYPRSEAEIEAVIASFAIPTRRYVLSVSSLESRKNLARVLEAWREASPHLPDDLWLVLAGSKANSSVFGKQQIHAIPPKVLFTGYVPDEALPALYSGAHVFFFPSLAEGFGLPLLEAMACGTRCLTSNTSSLPEIGGDAATFVDPESVHDIAAALIRLATAERTLNVAGLERAKLYTWSIAASKTRDLLLTEAEALVRNPDRTSLI